MSALSETETAACLLALAHENALSTREVSDAIDTLLATLTEPPRWLLDASLAASPEDKLHHLRLAPDAAGLAADALLSLSASVMAYRRRRIDAHDLASRGLHAAWDDPLPEEVKDAVYELEEDANCAHDYAGVPQPDRVARSIDALASRLAAHGRWLSLLAAFCPRPDPEP